MMLLRELVLLCLCCSFFCLQDVPITWWSSPRASLSCAVPDAERIPARRPPPPLNADDRARPKQPYIWRKGDEDLKRPQIGSNGTLDVRKKEGSEGVYQCAVRHHAGLVLGFPQRLKFAYLKQFIEQPEDTWVRRGQPAVLRCQSNSGPAAAISWQKDYEPLPRSNRYYALNDQLLILDVRSEDAGVYRCKASNSLANKTRISNGGSLTVEDVTEELPPGFLQVQHETSLAIPKGQKVLLPCPVTGFPKPKLIWEFTMPGERKSELEFTGEVLTLDKLDLDQEGVYACSVEGHSDLVKTFNVTVTVPVNITVPPSSKQTIRASTVRFNCTAVGNPAPVITWYKDGKPLVLTGRIVVRPSANDDKRMELLIRSVTSEDAGIYQCFAHNGHSWASSWAVLNVTGAGAAAPAGVGCWARGARNVLVRWPEVNGSMAYTVQIAKPGGPSLPRQPHTDTEETISLDEPLMPYRFQVRAYILSSSTNKNIASDMSESVTCQGQGVPIKIARIGDDIFVSWKQFARQTPDVLQWILQYKTQNSSDEHNITLGPAVTNYTITSSPSSLPLQVRVLGTRELPWLHQNLTMVPWTSTARATDNPDDGKLTGKIEKVEITGVGATELTVRWRCAEAEAAPEPYVFLVCTSKLDEKEDCVESRNTWVRVEGLWPASEYAVRVKATVPSRPDLNTSFTEPILISTQPEDSERIKDLTYKVVNGSSIRISWNSVPDKYAVYYNSELKLPINLWPCQETFGNTVLITGVDLSKELYVMVSGYEPVGHSSVLHIPVQVPGVKDQQFEYSGSGIKVTWKGEGTREVRYSQNLTQPMDKWRCVNVTGNSVHISGLEPSLVTYVSVGAPGQPTGHILTVPPPPTTHNNYSAYYLSVGLGCGVLVLALFAVAAACNWQRRKRARSPDRSRRRNVSPSEGHEEEGAEMKNVGGQLANGGGSKEAGEPLLNGHVHITENPNQSKTPNGRMRKGRRYEPTFDVARYEDPDTTQETILDDTSSTTFNLLDTSRRPELDLSRSSRDLSTNNSFSKLPDDNMNSELTRSTDFQLDNSKILPTLQPNG